MIIIEGPDAAGKSTVVEFIKNNSSIPLIKPFYPKKNQLSYYLHSPATYANFYLERYYISELVYPQFKPNRVKMEPWHQYLIEAGLMPFAPIILYIRPTKETIYENIKNRGDDYINLDEVDSMIQYYDKTIEKSYLARYVYDYKLNDLCSFLHMIESCYEFLLEQIKPFKKFLFSGDCENKNSLMFIGDMPSNQSIGNGYLRAFISDKGSSEFLHKCLYEAGFYPNKFMPYFTNWNKCENNYKLNLKALKEEIELLKPRKIIFFNKDIQKKVGIGEVLEHPSYIKRFHLKNYSWYIEKLKNL